MKIRFCVLVSCLLAVAAFAPFAEGATKYLSVSPTALLPYHSAITSLDFAKWDSYFYFLATSSTYDDAMMYAPLNLPHGATITSLTIYFTRDTGDGDIYMNSYLNRHALATGTTETMASVITWSSPSSPARKAMTAVKIKSAVINNSRYSYALLVGFSRPMNKLKFHGARIGYTE